MTIWEIAWLTIGAIGFAAIALGLGRVVRSAKLRTGRQRLQGFSVFDLQLTVGGCKSEEAPKTEAAMYLTIKTMPRQPSPAAKMLFDEKVRRLGE